MSVTYYKRSSHQAVYLNLLLRFPPLILDPFAQQGLVLSTQNNIFFALQPMVRSLPAQRAPPRRFKASSTVLNKTLPVDLPILVRVGRVVSIFGIEIFGVFPQDYRLNVCEHTFIVTVLRNFLLLAVQHC